MKSRRMTEYPVNRLSHSFLLQWAFLPQASVEGKHSHKHLTNWQMNQEWHFRMHQVGLIWESFCRYKDHRFPWSLSTTQSATGSKLESQFDLKCMQCASVAISLWFPEVIQQIHTIYIKKKKKKKKKSGNPKCEIHSLNFDTSTELFLQSHTLDWAVHKLGSKYCGFCLWMWALVYHTHYKTCCGADSLSVFKKRLKTFLFDKTYR